MDQLRGSVDDGAIAPFHDRRDASVFDVRRGTLGSKGLSVVTRVGVDALTALQGNEQGAVGADAVEVFVQVGEESIMALPPAREHPHEVGQMINRPLT